MRVPGTKRRAGRQVSLRLNAFEQLRAEKKLRRLAQLLVGLIGYGASLSFLVESSLGAASWSVLAEGLALRTGLSFGAAVNIISLTVLVFWIPLRELPGLGTILNVVLVGSAADVAASLIPSPDSLIKQLVYVGIGLIMFAFFDAVYLGSRFGSGPRDGLMTGAVRLTGQPVWVTRAGIDVVVFTLGWVLGGTVGVGTLLLALVAGPLIQICLRYVTVSLELDSRSTAPEQGLSA